MVWLLWGVVVCVVVRGMGLVLVEVLFVLVWFCCIVSLFELEFEDLLV